MRDIEIRPDDRILYLPIPGDDELREAARKAYDGLVVGIGSEDAVRSGRKAVVDYDNVMLVQESDNGQIPWQEEFFTKVIAPEHLEADAEMRRVLAPGGRTYLAEQR
jgi:hypothetical protein